MHDNVLPPLETRVGCIGATMHVIGQKWTALILRDLSSGPKRFRDFNESMPTLNPRTLSARLESLQEQEVISVCPDGGYQLTNKGEALIPVLKAMADWGERWS
ncbi:TPA: transcriptional regulator [Candidatus Saccharibacteria bacterium]|nr:transcriptional regulator [Candidatus Saccharibacteria bacterium]HRK40618.1 helix-turn-helix domain-containing protein [Candidatus Saccharibacteria bacterium]